MMLSARRGFLLVSVLLITIIVLTLGLTFLGKKAIQYRRVAYREQAAQAKALAESGLEDALLKLRRDIEFPPLAVDQEDFSYTERVGEVGSYTVTINGTYRFPPYAIFVITSVGLAGSDPHRPRAKRTVRAEFDIQPRSRTKKGEVNPFYYEIIQYQDLGGL